MSNNELLLAISDMMDQKLDVINVRMDTMADKLINKIDDVDNRLSAKIEEVDNRLSAEIKKINLTQENVIIPRLNHIEQCYVATSERYMNATGQINRLNIGQKKKGQH